MKKKTSTMSGLRSLRSIDWSPVKGEINSITPTIPTTPERGNKNLNIKIQ